MKSQDQIVTASLVRGTSYRTDQNRNPTAFSTAVAAQAGLLIGKDYVNGSAFPDDPGLFTAHLLGDPVKITIRVINALGFVTESGEPRWSYIIMPHFIWARLSVYVQCDVIGFMYRMEGGTAMVPLFPSYNEN